MTGDRRGPRVFSIPAGVPFLPTLADAILSGGLVDLGGDDPLALADVTILLPTRRAVRALRDVLIGRLGGGAAILPTIRTIGDVDEEDHLLAVSAETDTDLLALPPSISRLARRLALTRLTLEWGRVVRRELLKLGPDEPLLIAASAADATRLAGDLARLLDDLETAGCPFSAIGDLVPDDSTGYFRITLEFLRIVSEQWPGILAALNRADPAARRNQLIVAEAERLEGAPTSLPIIAAGSTGSIPATAKLLKAIANLPNGAVVLPGLDTALDDAAFAAIGDPSDGAGAVVGHPQFGMKKLIADIGVARNDVAALGVPAAPVAARMQIVSEAMRPAETVETWADFRRDTLDSALSRGAFADVGLILARNEREEALAIAVAFREAMQDPGATAALVTPDRDLAGRVAVELGRWNLAVDDSAGTPLARLPPAIFAMLVVEAALAQGEAVALLALLDHPLAAFGIGRARCRSATRALEIALLRGGRVTGGVAALRPALARARAEAADPSKRHVAATRRRLQQSAWDDADRLLVAVESALGPLETLLKQAGNISAASLADGLVAALRQAAADDGGNDHDLWRGNAGEALARLLSELIESGGELTLNGREAPSFLGALMADSAVTRPVGEEARIRIWGGLEARLQSVDLIVLGGLDEGVWPAATRADPFLSRSMRAEIGLAPPERRIGLSAHDFAQGFGAKKVIVTRAEKRGGTPTVASRWFLRLTALLGEEPEKQLRRRGDAWIEIARNLDRVDRKNVVPDPPPAPKPPVPARPRSLSVTEIETLIRDPYAIYARHILRLEPLEPLGVAPDYALRGTLIHDALGKFVQEWTGDFDHAAEARLLEIGRDVLAAIADIPDIHAVWSHRFAAIARWFIGWERGHSADIVRRCAEIDGVWEVEMPGGFRLRGRADRIDIRQDGHLEILDFKTGAPPSAKQVLTGLSPQLALEVAMARQGAFGDAFKKKPVEVLGWLALGQVTRGEVFRNAVDKERTADNLGVDAERRLKELIAAYDEEDRAYVSRARPMFMGRYGSPYDHLARVREWSLLNASDEPA